jgi:hypothetical protein
MRISFNREGIATDRFLLQGSLLEFATGSTRVCIGYEKIHYLEEMMRLHTVVNASLEYAYTDNGLFADLPLLSRAQHSVVISSYSPLYDFVSDKVITSCTFYPKWGRKS